MVERETNTPHPRAVVATRTLTGGERLRRVLGADHRMAYIFVLPMVVLVLGLVAYPFFYSIYLSFTDKPIGGEPTFVGLKNYIRLWNDRSFREAAINSVVFTLASVLFKFLLGLVMALVLNARIRGRSLWTALFLIPWITPAVVAALNWMWMYEATQGIINYLLSGAHLIDRPMAWLSERNTAMLSVVITNVWRGFSFYGVTLLAGLQSIPHEHYEAAEIDGATWWQSFWHVTLPSLRNVIIVVTLLSSIWTFNDFQQIWIMTRGGPGGATEIFATLSYEVAFGAQRLGEAVAISIYLLPVFAFMILTLARYMQRGQQAQ